jgi:hypothetical protein
MAMPLLRKLKETEIIMFLLARALNGRGSMVMDTLK